MPYTPKPMRLLSRFNKASRILLSATAIGMMLASSAATPVMAKTDTETTSVQEDDSVNYEYLGNRTIRITGSINKATAIQIIDKLIELSEADPEADIELRINSGGGSVPDGMAIYDVMKSLPNDIRTVCEGEAQSMAAFLLSAGTQGKRYAYPNCQIMYHQPSWGTSGQITNMDIITSQGNALKDKMIEIIAEDTGWNEEIIRDLLERNFYPSVEEAQEMGFIDHVIEEQSPDVAPAPKTKLPDGFCDNPGRRHMDVCSP